MPDQNGHSFSSDAEDKAAQYQQMQGDSPPAQTEPGQPVSPAEEPASGSAEQSEPAPVAQPASSPDSLLHAELKAARAEAEHNKEALLRYAADLENTRRRSAEEVAKAHKFAIEGFAKNLLPVKDSLEAALSLENQSLESLTEGVTATLRQLEHALEQGHVKVLNPKGEKFDPNLHQAVSAVPGSSLEPPVPVNHVVDVMQKGYLINERVLRPALVVVAQ